MLGYVAFVLGCFLMIAPWGARNFVRTGSLYLLGTGERTIYAQFEARNRWLLWTTWNPEQSGKLRSYQEFSEKRRAAYEAGKKAGMGSEEIITALALREIRNDPLEALRAYVVRVYSLWIMIPTSQSETLRMGSVLVEIAILLAGLAGLWLHRRHFIPRGLPIALFVVSQAVLLPLVHTEGRYGVSLKPFLLAGVGLLGLTMWDGLRLREMVQGGKERAYRLLRKKALS